MSQKCTEKLRRILTPQSRLGRLLRNLIGVVAFVAMIITIIEYIGPLLEDLIVPLPPPGVIIFDADEWHEQVIGGKQEIVCTPQTELNVELRKVGVGMDDATVEENLTYSKPRNNALEINYEFTKGTEIGVHFVIRGFRPAPSNFIRLDKDEEGDIFLRVKPMPIDDGTNADDHPPVTFGLKLLQGDTSFWNNESYSCARGKRYWLSGWHDIRIPIKPYLDQMRKVSSTESDRSRLDGLVIYFAERYSLPHHGLFWLNTIRLIKEKGERD